MKTNNLIKNQHIAMWTYQRSRSTLIARAFEQLDDCIVFDEPFYGCYFLKYSLQYPSKGNVLEPSEKDVLKHCETDYKKNIEALIAPLPNHASFSFQKHIAKHALPEFGRNWLKSFYNFFLIRDPKEVVLSWYKVYGKVTSQNIGIAELYNIFKEVEAFSGTIPLVIDSKDLVKNPKKVLNILCSDLGVKFSEKMLTWQPGLPDSQLLFTGAFSSFASTWYSTVMNSSGFLPYEEKQVNLPSELQPLVEECLPFYEKMYQHRRIFS